MGQSIVYVAPWIFLVVAAILYYFWDIAEGTAKLYYEFDDEKVDTVDGVRPETMEEQEVREFDEWVESIVTIALIPAGFLLRVVAYVKKLSFFDMYRSLFLDLFHLLFPARLMSDIGFIWRFAAIQMPS